MGVSGDCLKSRNSASSGPRVAQLYTEGRSVSIGAAVKLKGLGASRSSIAMNFPGMRVPLFGHLGFVAYWLMILALSFVYIRAALKAIKQPDPAPYLGTT